MITGPLGTPVLGILVLGNFDPGAAPAAGRIMGPLAGEGGLAGPGGLAGKGGGMAGR